LVLTSRGPHDICVENRMDTSDGFAQSWQHRKQPSQPAI
jgi:hypothetical protein